MINLRQLVPFRQIDQKMRLSSALPPSRVVVIFRDLHEPELLVVVGADPFGGIDRALLERRKDIATRKLLRNYTQLRQDAPGKTADAELQASHIIQRLYLLPQPPPHLPSPIPHPHAPP